MADDETRALHAEQRRRADREALLADQAEQADQPDAEAEHLRRAEKARYLKEKLEERARSEEP